MILYVPLAVLLVPGAEAARRKPAPPPAPAEAPPPGPSPAELSVVEALESPRLPTARYLFLLESSGAMAEPARASLEGIANLVRELRAGDEVGIATFHVRAIEALPWTKVEDADREALATRIQSLPLPSAKDADLGAGLSYAIDHLSGDGAAPLQFLFISSTFCHDPTLRSEYDSGGRGCRAIRGMDKLVERYAKAKGDSLLAMTLLGTSTPDRPLDAAGLASVRSVLGEGTLIETANTSFSAWSAAYRARLRVERVLPLVRQDATTAALGLKVLREPTPKNPSALLEVTANTRWLTMTLGDLRVSGEAAGAVPPTLSLTPSVTLEVPVRPPKTPLAILPHEDVVPLEIVLGGEGSLQPAEGLEALGVPAARPGQQASVTAKWARSYGLPGWLVAVLFTGFTAVAAGVAIFVTRRMRRVRLGGAFSYRRQGGPRVPLALADAEAAWIALDEEGNLVNRRQNAVMALRMVKRGLDAYAEVEILVDGIEINRKPARRGRHRVVAGATSFQFGDYRLTWE